MCIHGMEWRQWIWTYIWSDINDAILCVRQIVYMNKNGGFLCAHRVKDVYRHLVFDKVKYGHWQLLIRNSEKWFGRWYEAGRLHLEKAESIQLCHFRVGQAATGAEAQFWLLQPWRNLPLFFPPSSLRVLPLLLFNDGLGVSRWKNCGIKDVCRYVLAV